MGRSARPAFHTFCPWVGHYPIFTQERSYANYEEPDVKIAELFTRLLLRLADHGVEPLGSRGRTAGRVRDRLRANRPEKLSIT